VSEGTISPDDARELAACFRAEARDLFGYACRLVRGDQALADDLVQAAFEAAGLAWPRLRGLDGEQRRSWLRRTVSNKAVSFFRRDAALRERLHRIEARYRKPPADPVEVVFSAIALQRCWQIIRDLPKRQYAVALLRWQLDMKEAEIAAVLGMAENTVSVHLHTVRSKLIAQLGPQSPAGGPGREGGAA
jgi:RNA polymerase sigma-70 factor (ECF subfamily)